MTARKQLKAGDKVKFTYIPTYPKGQLPDGTITTVDAVGSAGVYLFIPGRLHAKEWAFMDEVRLLKSAKPNRGAVK